MSTAAASAPSAAVSPLACSLPLRLIDSCTFHRFDNGGGAEEYLLALTDGRQFKLSRLAHRLLTSLDGNTSFAAISAELSADGIEVAPEKLEQLLTSQYGRLGIFANGPKDDEADGAVAAARHSDGVGSAMPRPGFPLWAIGSLLPARLVGGAARALRFLYAPAAVLPLLVLIGWSHLWIYAQPFHPTGFLPESYLAIVVLVLASMLFHELGHAAALSRFGGTPGRIGFGLYILMPTFFADVSQLWRFPRRQRMVADLGGAYFQQLAFAAFAFFAARSGRIELLASCRMIDLLVLVAVNPIFRFDGYWFLADYLAIPKLHGVALRYPLWCLRKWLGRPVEPLRLPPMRPLARTVFVGYSLLAGLFLVFALWLSYNYLANALIQFPAAAGRALEATRTALAQGEIALSLTRLLAVFFLIAVPATVVLALGSSLFVLGRAAVRRLRRRALPGLVRSSP